VTSPDFRAVIAAHERLAGIAHRTPVHRSRQLDERLGARVYLKCENFQRAGAFKFRGAYNALSRLDEADRRRGAITHSSGNHAQALALAGSLLGIRTVIVMPEDAPAVKLAATRAYGAEVVLYDRRRETREELSARLAAERGLTLIPPFDHPDVIAGQGTVAKELIEQVGPLDVLVVCLGGGGLLSGCALAAHALSPGIAVYGVEPEAGNDGRQSFYGGRRMTIEEPDTIADGARTRALGELTFPLIQRLCRDIVTVDDAALVRALRFVYERLGLAALLEGKLDVRGQRVGVVISGGNVDLARLAGWFGAQQEAT
jgi:threonine dehydratase